MQASSSEVPISGIEVAMLSYVMVFAPLIVLEKLSNSVPRVTPIFLPFRSAEDSIPLSFGQRITVTGV